MRPSVKLTLALFMLASLTQSQEIRRPTVETTSAPSPLCTWSIVVAVAAPNFYDASGETTSSIVTGLEVDDATWRGSGATYSGFAAASGGYSSLNLVFYTQCTRVDSLINNNCALEYSLNSGSTWTTVYSSGNANRALTRDTVPISSAQNLTQIRVRYCVNGFADSGSSAFGSMRITAYDIRTEGILSGGSSSPPRKAQVVGAK